MTDLKQIGVMLLVLTSLAGNATLAVKLFNRTQDLQQCADELSDNTAAIKAAALLSEQQAVRLRDAETQAAALHAAETARVQTLLTARIPDDCNGAVRYGLSLIRSEL